MARKKSTTLTEAELRLMNVLWTRGSATVNDVLEGLSSEPPLAYNTVLTTLRILEEKGYVRHKKDGRAFLYVPKVQREQAQKSALRQLLSRFFENSAEQLVLNVLKNERLDADELRRLKTMIGEAES
ncbi:BlaI/MecI/CopY family transcriptional regulator [Bryobacter aggregatus]|uniref:BlaI/MecI/CopY family transcriptional regulator n=1 Tax=Bryobacter aggregatus TaxID=360054 RepID=UPI0004E28B8E|nr:BlaI/MecI/CopY family transcriptional regulator [Bryobacter aggregatus]